MLLRFIRSAASLPWKTISMALSWKRSANHSNASSVTTSTSSGGWPGPWRQRICPWLLASRLRERGANYFGGTAYQAFNVQDGNLFTGQNPALSGPMADAIIAAFAQRP